MMSLRRFLSKNRNAEAGRSSQRVDDGPASSSRPATHTSNMKVLNVTTAPSHNLPGRDSLTETLSIAETSEVATRSTNYIYYRIYAEDGAIPSKTPVTPGDAFLGRIKARSVPPPRNAKAVKCSIAKVENIRDSTSNSLFLTPYSGSPMGDAEKITILNGTGPGSTPQEPLALVAKMSDSERTTLESEGRGGVPSATEPDTTPRYVYYMLYADGYEIPSKVSIDPEEPSFGRIRAESIAPPHSPTSIIKRCISRVKRNLGLAHADLFADTSCDTPSPLKEAHISLLRTDGPGLSPNEPMAIVRVKKIPESLPVRVASIPDGKYAIRNRAADTYWCAVFNPTQFSYVAMDHVKDKDYYQWHILSDTNGNISITSSSPKFSSSWVGKITGSKVPVLWRLIPADGKFYYLTTNLNLTSRKPRVLVAQVGTGKTTAPGLMAALKKGDQIQMWEFIRL